MISEYELTIEKRPLYLYVCIRGPEERGPKVRESLSEILEVFHTTQYSRLLIKNELPSALDKEDLNYVIDEIVRQGSQGLKLAIVEDIYSQDKEKALSAVVASARGLDVAFFDSFAAAVHWMLHG